MDQSEKLLCGKKLSKVDTEEAKGLLNYKKSFDFVSDYLLSQMPITEGLIREIHKKLVEGVRGNSAQPGEYRKIQNYVANSKTKEVIYTPPAAYEVPFLMAQLMDWIQNERTIPAILVSGIAKFQLVHIHLFLDGNGRTAHLLSTLCLYRFSCDFKKLFTISEYYDRNRMNYYQAIQSVRTNNMDMTIWLEYFSKGLETQMREIQLKGTHAMKLDFLTAKHQLSERQKQILLETNEDFTIQQYESLYKDISRRTLQRDLSDLVEKKLICQVGERKTTHYRINLD